MERNTSARAFIRYCHAERGIQSGLTRDTLKAVDLSEPEYQKLVRAPRHQGAMALLEQMGALGGTEPDNDPEWFEPDFIAERDINAYLLGLRTGRRQNSQADDKVVDKCPLNLYS